MGMSAQNHAPAALPPRKSPYPLYRRPGGTKGQYGRVRKILPPPAFEPQTIQAVASRETDWAIFVPWEEGINTKCWEEKMG